MAEKFSLKDELFNPEKVSKIAGEIKEVFSAFEQERFKEEVVALFPELELKERSYHIRDVLAKYLPDDYREATTILLNALPPELDPLKRDDDFGDFIYSPYSEFVTTYGCNKEHLAFSLDALREMTKRFSVEFAIRDFINNFPTETFKMLEACSLSENYHERRLASEGCRPKLPWGKKLSIDYTLTIKLLDNLFMDKTRFVTRSVANHLNDISKIDAPLVIETLKKWKKSKKQDEKEMLFIMTHALRTLVKDGNVKALAFLGYRENPNIVLKDFKLMKSNVKIGESLEMEFFIEAKEDESLIIDYIIHFINKSGKKSSKVYKIKKLTIKKEELISLFKKHPFKLNMSTRNFYAGQHKVELQINGKIHGDAHFNLEL